MINALSFIGSWESHGMGQPQTAMGWDRTKCSADKPGFAQHSNLWNRLSTPFRFQRLNSIVNILRSTAQDRSTLTLLENNSMTSTSNLLCGHWPDFF